jgi:hypothetical protein
MRRPKCRADRLLGVDRRQAKMRRVALRPFAVPAERVFTNDEIEAGVHQQWIGRVREASQRMAPHGIDVEVVRNGYDDGQGATIRIVAHTRPPQYAPAILS